MTDRELLELAAKAAGIVIVSPVERCVVQPLPEHVDGFIVENSKGGHSPWNPLGDDGDALRLAVKFGMQIDTRHPETRVYAPIYDVVCEYHKPDATAATRRAITRAAAEIVKQMP